MGKVNFDLDRKAFIKELVLKLEKSEKENLPNLFFDITIFRESKSNTGIQRVVHAWLEYLPKEIAGEYNLVPIYYDLKKELYLYEGDCSHIVEPEKGDVYLSIDLNAGSQINSVSTLLRWKKNGCLLLVCLYDIGFILYPQTIINDATRGILTRWLVFILENFDGIIAISKTVMEDALYYAKCKGINNANRQFSYCHMGCETQDDSRAQLSENVLRLTNTNVHNFISVSTIEPRNGYYELINSFESAVKKGLKSNMIIVGRKGWGAETIVDRIEKSPYYEKQIFWFSDCSDETLKELYSIADFYVSASYYEGFGLGLIEGASYNLPLLVRDIPIYREICGKNAVYFNNNNSLTDKLIYCETNREKLSKMVIRPLSWGESVKTGWHEIKKMIEGKGAKQNNIKLKKHINLLVSHLSWQDGVGSDIFFQKEVIEELGYDCEIFSCNCDKESENYRRNISDLYCAPEDLIIDHICGYYDYVPYIAKQPCRRVFLYHNITSPVFLSGKVRVLCKKGLRQIPKVYQIYDFIAGVSQYNLDCLKELGVQAAGDVLPIPVEFNYPKPQKVYSSKKETKFLFVGRVVQNKKFENIIDSFAYYHNNYNKNSELTLVGKNDVSQEYTDFVISKINKSGCSEVIKLTGKISDEELQEIYRNSDVFLCMSEHEGFCIPLLEAMYNGLIVFAYNSTAIAETMGGAGVLLEDKTPEKVASVLDNTLSNEKQANLIIKEESSRVEDFSKAVVKEKLKHLIEKWTSEEYKGHGAVEIFSKKYMPNHLIDSARLWSLYEIKKKIKSFIKKVIRKSMC